MSSAGDGVSLYRSLLRTIKLVFKDDTQTIIRAREKVKSVFEEHRQLGSAASVKEQIAFGREVEQFLLRNIAQGIKLDGKSSKYLVKIEPRHEMAENEATSEADQKNHRPVGPCATRCPDCTCSPAP